MDEGFRIEREDNVVHDGVVRGVSVVLNNGLYCASREPGFLFVEKRTGKRGLTSLASRGAFVGRRVRGRPRFEPRQPAKQVLELWRARARVRGCGSARSDNIPLSGVCSSRERRVRPCRPVRVGSRSETSVG